MLLIELSKDTELRGGKKRLFLTGGKKQGQLLKSLAHMILDAYDCTCIIDIRPEEKVKDPEERAAMLGQFEVIVFAVTGDFLSEPCPARVFDLRYAAENKLHILPVLCEPGLEGQFGRVCGHYHLINALRDSFNEELLEYIEGRIDIRYPVPGQADPFSHKAFVSYRKADRVQLLRVMDAFRSIPGCVNTELWYDDFLIKGENYDFDIARALESSDFMLLTATPRLFAPSAEGGKNYVEAIEYPDAVKLGKPVLAVEAEPLDREEFSRRFPEAVLVSIKDRQGLADAVSRILGSSVYEPPLLTPEQACELGNAYMTGRRVRRDTAAALELYRGAAGHGCEQGYFRLAKYYGSSDQPEALGLAYQYYESYSAAAAKKLHDIYESLDPQDIRLIRYFIELCGCLADVLLEYSDLAMKAETDPDRLRFLLSTNRRDYTDICKMLASLGIPPSERINPGCGDLMLVPVLIEDKYYEDAMRLISGAEKEFELAFAGRRTAFTQGQYARLRYSRGLIYSRTGRLYDAAEDMREALELFIRVTEITHSGRDRAVQAADDLYRIARGLEAAENDSETAAKLYRELCGQYQALCRSKE